MVSQFNGTSTPKGSYSVKTGDNDCNVNSSCYSLHCAREIRYQAKSEQNVWQDPIPRVRHREAALLHLSFLLEEKYWKTFNASTQSCTKVWMQFKQYDVQHWRCHKSSAVNNWVFWLLSGRCTRLKIFLMSGMCWAQVPLMGQSNTAELMTTGWKSLARRHHQAHPCSRFFKNLWRPPYAWRMGMQRLREVCLSARESSIQNEHCCLMIQLMLSGARKMLCVSLDPAKHIWCTWPLPCVKQEVQLMQCTGNTLIKKRKNYIKRRCWVSDQSHMPPMCLISWYTGQENLWNTARRDSPLSPTGMQHYCCWEWDPGSVSGFARHGIYNNIGLLWFLASMYVSGLWV